MGGYMMFGKIDKPKIFHGTLHNSFSLESLSQNWKQIAPASLLSFPLKIKRQFHKNIKDDFVILFMEVEHIGNTQIILMEET